MKNRWKYTNAILAAIVLTGTMLLIPMNTYAASGDEQEINDDNQKNSSQKNTSAEESLTDIINNTITRNEDSANIIKNAERLTNVTYIAPRGIISPDDPNVDYLFTGILYEAKIITHADAGKSGIAGGFYTVAEDWGTSIGTQAYANVRGSTLGYHASSSENAVAIGYRTTASKGYSIAIGSKTHAAENSSIAIGNSANAGAIASIAIGMGSSVKNGNVLTESDGLALGYNTVAEGNGIAVGSSANAKAGAISLGIGSEAGEWGFAAGIDAKAGAKGIAIGSWANTAETNSIAIGSLANAEADSSIAIGMGSSVKGGDGIAVGHDIKLEGNGIAVGSRANAKTDAISFGIDAQAGADAISFGKNANGGIQGISIGNGTVTLENGIALGKDANAAEAGISLGNGAITAKNGIALGNSVNGGIEGISIGKGATTLEHGIALGIGADAAEDGFSLGHGAITAKNGIALGNSANGGIEGISIGTGAATLDHGIALGIGADVAEAGFSLGNGAKTAKNGIALGKGANAAEAGFSLGNGAKTAKNGIALGNDSIVEIENSVALGANSEVNSEVNSDDILTESNYRHEFGWDAVSDGDNGVVSIGHSGADRRLLHVANGRITSGATDAANGGQLYEVWKNLYDQIVGANEYPGDAVPNGDTSTTPGGDTSMTPGGDTSTTPGGDTSTTPGGDTSTTPGGDASTTPGGDTSTTPGGDTSTTPGGDTSTTPGGDTSTTPGGDASTTPGGDTNTTPGGDANTTLENPVNPGTGDQDQSKSDFQLVNGTDTIIDQNGVATQVAGKDTGYKADGNGNIDLQIKDKEDGTTRHVVITDVASAEKLTEVDGRVTQNTMNIERLKQSVNHLDSRVDRVGAGAAALAALHPLDFDPDEKWDFAAGYGHYRSANAAALGMYYRPNEDTMFSIGGSMGGGENLFNAGVSIKLGSGSSHISTSRVAMAKEIKEMRKKMEAMKTAMLDAYAGKRIDTSKMQSFPDVPQNHWAYEYVAGLAENGVLEGYPDDSFGGNRTMTRYEFAAMLYRAMLNGATLSDKILTEFGPELEHFTVDTIHADKDGNPMVERVRVKQ